MDYDQFDAAYGEVLAGARSLDATALESEVSRLRALAAELPSPADQQAAHLLIASLEDALGRPQPSLSPELAAAIRIQSTAQTTEGTPADRIQAIREAINQIAAIANTAPPTEQGPIADLNEPLHLLLDSLTSATSTPTHPQPGADDARN
ncbi:hypothetical protein [Kribbella lupini]|uniref:Hpt domain-containing protein n=1 Tax=Kribbella lupini TaxID=291602 RepID=A0ABN2BJQ4_9ACTN